MVMEEGFFPNVHITKQALFCKMVRKGVKNVKNCPRGLWMTPYDDRTNFHPTQKTEADFTRVAMQSFAQWDNFKCQLISKLKKVFKKLMGRSLFAFYFVGCNFVILVSRLL